MKTSDLTGPALDWAVELTNGTHWSTNGFFCYAPHERSYPYSKEPLHSYSTDWSQGGPIIEREGIALYNDAFLGKWIATDVIECVEYETEGPTPLIAAMRCYVASKLGDEVDVPKELT